ncbi:MAG TPA: ThuA domain-containing protein [Candidatus Saccharimonadales bacterium]|nr:ThuA domain-containing protein [Candidatus Saccharimonadales bacterium]
MRRLTLVAGRPSHAPGEHEFLAGMELLADCLAGVPDLSVRVVADGDLGDEVLAGTDALVLFADGGGGHPFLEDDRLTALAARVEGGLAIGLMHFAVEIPSDRGGREVTEWIGGFYQDGVSCNPIWDASFETFPEHPVTRGVGPFTVRDEWYFNLRFAEPGQGGMSGAIQPILVTVPSDEVRAGPYVWPQGPYPHIVAASGREEVLMWVRERPGRPRGFGLTGGHFHTNWRNDDFRRVVLNALVWLSGLEVPVGGVDSTLTTAEGA